MPVYGYARVSTAGQTLAAQDAELAKAGAAKVYRETASGAKTDRPVLAKLLKRLEPGDVVMITRLDRLARSTRDLLKGNLEPAHRRLSKLGGSLRPQSSYPDRWAEKGVRKEDHVLAWQRRMTRNNAYGVYFIFKSMQQGPTFRISVPKYPTRDPLNDTTITLYKSCEHDELEFFHVKLESHDVIYAEGAPVETLLNVDENAVNFVDYLRKCGIPEPCVPIIPYGGDVPHCSRRSAARSRRGLIAESGLM
jgi:hypothetical protein